jgi:alpha-amylase/alpha-mannosidase (GH57 family)
MEHAVIHNVSVALFWHFHQPMYSKPDDPVFPLPWVRLHCLKDYLDMLTHVQNHPDIRVTFNFTPSLLVQIDDYRTNKCTDRQFQLFRKKAEELTIEEKTEILRDFFLAHWENMIEAHRRYFSLLLKRGKNIVEGELESIAQSFTADEFRDLQIWANLVWIDPLFRSDLDDLYSKGKNFKEEDKDRVMAVQQRIIGSIFGEYRKAMETGQIEITTSPLYHPILPLLINSNLAKVSNPNLVIPFEFKHAEDAVTQITKGIEVFERAFGRKPRGLWPPEGSVCNEIIPMLKDNNIEWIATDEEILALSLNTSLYRNEQGVPSRPDLLYKPWKLNDMKIIFRDHMLSDLIGFTYNQWDQKKAAQDLISRLQNLKNSLPSFEKFIVPIILDGENAWESYVNDGSEFLEELYGGLVNNGITTTTVSHFLDEQPPNELPSLFPGSWIGANFNIWIGHEEDHKGWLIVQNIRNRLTAKKITDPDIWDRFYILEGSDWYWWFGREHFSAVAEIFDELFRLNAIWIYKKIGEEAPPELYSQIKKYEETLTVQPNDKMTPEIDGKITHFYEWYYAGHADVMRMGGTMHRFAGLFSKIYCGFDDENLYIRFDIENHSIDAYEYTVKFYTPKEIHIPLEENAQIRYKIDQIVELAIPKVQLGIDGAGEVEFILSAQQKGVEIDRTPLLKFTVRLQDVKLHNWTI